MLDLTVLDQWVNVAAVVLKRELALTVMVVELITNKMKKYNVKNYIRYKEDVKQAIANVQLKDFVNYTNEELKVIFLPLVENISRKFATSQEASGVMSIMDIIQEGSLQLCKAVDKIDKESIIKSNS